MTPWRNLELDLRSVCRNLHCLCVAVSLHSRSSLEEACASIHYARSFEKHRFIPAVLVVITRPSTHEPYAEAKLELTEEDVDTVAHVLDDCAWIHVFLNNNGVTCQCGVPWLQLVARHVLACRRRLANAKTGFCSLQ
jgi:hypothetical protein